MRPSRLDFYDPLYDFITFEEAIKQRPREFLDVGFARKDASNYGESISPLKAAKVILPFISSIEFTRQSFLRQSNLAFLVYPSATHTRFAHAIGACYLGFIAAQRVAVNIRAKNRIMQPAIYLSKFLEDTGWREEFYLALLLHDVGHFPFSHVFENNKELWDTLEKDIHHEEAACQLIQGKGPIWEASVRRIKDVRKYRKQDHPHLSELFSDVPETDKDAICYLISGNTQEYLSKKTTPQKAQLRMIHALVSGLLDLDRIDHYRRDNLFTGLRTGTSPNFPSLLSGLTIFYNPNDPESPPEIRLTPSAIGPAISLLQNKERLTEDCFDHPNNIANEGMLHQAFNMYLFGDDFYQQENFDKINEELLCELLVSTDDELLYRLIQTGSKKVKEIVFRIMNRAPYRVVAKLCFPPEHRYTIREIRNIIFSFAKIDKCNIIIRATKKFGSGDLKVRPEEWLDLERLLNVEGKRLVDGKYKRQIEHFKQAQEAPDFLWLYCVNDKNANIISDVLHKICKELNCHHEDI